MREDGHAGWYERKPRLPGPSAPRARGRRPFGTSWWGRAWVEALEQRAQLDPNRLPRGRSYARTGAVGALTLSPGEVLAEVQGSRRNPYKVRVRVRQFDDGEWESVLDAFATEIGHTAALLEGELPAAIADDVGSVGLDLLPGPGELQARCSCPDWADPCKHAAAVCYLVADSLDADPFGVLLLRGRAREELLAGLRARRSLGAGQAGAGSSLSIEPEADRGIPARQAWSRTPGALPGLPPAPRRVGQPASLAADPPGDSGVDLRVVRALALDASMRALALLAGASSSGLELGLEEDLARRASALVGDVAVRSSVTLKELAEGAGLGAPELLRRALAFRYGGTEGLAVLGEPWDPGPGPLSVGRALLGRSARSWRNRVTLGERQLRLGRDGRWYPFRRDGTGHWSPDGSPLAAATEDEVGALLDEEEDAD